MGAAAFAESLVSPADYLAGERLGDVKHEYLDGVVYATAGTTVQHDRIAGNIYRALGNQLQGGPCEPFSSDVKVRIESAGAKFYYYPDVTVDCAEPHPASLFAEAPRVIFEVLSPDTERIDRGEKFRNYQTVPSLAVYVFADQFHRFLTVYRRVGDGWRSELLEGDAVLPLPEIGCQLPISAVYERTGVP